MAAFGVVMVIYSEKFFAVFGRVTFAEKYLGLSGGSRLFYKLLGILIFLVGLGITIEIHKSLLPSFLPFFSGLE